jgi:hydroxyethylthiazole kinase
MLISPPFLPTRNAGESDSAFIARAMRTADHGRYPVSLELGWHGGIHLIAPSDGDNHLPVRAIAYGTIVHVQKPEAKPQTFEEVSTHDLNYMGEPNRDCWTDNGCVVIRHDNEIGADANDQATSVRFYSIYIHLRSIDAAVVKNAKIERKAVLGEAGSFEGEEHRLHFEIICDDENLTQLIGRNSGDLSVAIDGRQDTVFGELYFRAPADTNVWAERPSLHQSAGAETDTQETVGEDIYVGIRYESGSAYVQTYNNDGQIIGAELTETNAEYNLYSFSENIVQAFRNAHAPAIPSRTAVFELYRLGRILGPDALNPADAPHWRKINLPIGERWINLNGANILKFSDADAPHWKGWKLLEDYEDNNSRCDVDVIRREMDINADGEITREEIISQLASETVCDKLKGMVCKFPTEWHKDSIGTRWEWLTTEIRPDTGQPWVAAGDPFNNFVKYSSALAFWEDAGIDTSEVHWHFHPIRFIEHFRKCGWRSKRELVQLVPSHAIRRHNGNVWEAVSAPDNRVIVNGLRFNLNRMLQKYGINTPMRQAGFFGNSIQETMWFASFSEGSGNATWYAPWFGRGLLQLTTPGNYIDYWRWRGRTVPETLKTALNTAYNAAYNTHPHPLGTLLDANFPGVTPVMIGWRNVIGGRNEDGTNPTVIAGEPAFAPFDSAGYYWLQSGMARYADEPGTQNLERRSVQTTDAGAKVYYRSQGFWRVSAAVNLPARVNYTNYSGLNGFDSRCCAYGIAIAILTEQLLPDAQGNNTLFFPEGYTMRKP